MLIYGLHSKAHKHTCVPTQISPAHMHTTHTHIHTRAKRCIQQLSSLQEILKSILRNYERRWHLGQQSWCDAMQLRLDTIMHSWEDILKSQAVTHITLCSGHWAKPPININIFNLQTTKGEKRYPSFPDSSTESQVSYIRPPSHTPDTNALFQMIAFLTSTQKTPGHLTATQPSHAVSNKW